MFIHFSVQCNIGLLCFPGKTWTEIPEVIDWPLSQSKIEKWILWYHRLTLNKRTKAVGKLRW